MSTEGILTIAVLAVFALHAVFAIRDLLVDRRHARALRLVVSYMVVWAETWGDPPDQVKAALMKVREQARL